MAGEVLSAPVGSRPDSRGSVDSLAEIVRNDNLAHTYFRLTFTMRRAAVPIPGQFYQVRCSSSIDPLFRRPFSAHRVVRGRGSLSVEILYRVVGRGTEWLSRRKRGEPLDVLGPFGNGFLIDKSQDAIVLVARGTGIASVYAVGAEVRRKCAKREIFILLGARMEERVFYEAECRKLGTVFVYTDDGSKGFRGRAPDLLAHLAREKRIPERFSVYACGPARMLQDLATLSRDLGFHGQAALEERLGCGFSACLVCACPLKPDAIVRNQQWEKPALHWSDDGTQVYSLVCKDGPIYDLNEVDWDEWTA